MRSLRAPVLSVFLISFIAITSAAAATVAPPDATVEGRTLPEWSAQWWQSDFAIHVYAADCTTVIHP